MIKNRWTDNIEFIFKRIKRKINVKILKINRKLKNLLSYLVMHQLLVKSLANFRRKILYNCLWMYWKHILFKSLLCKTKVKQKSWIFPEENLSLTNSQMLYFFNTIQQSDFTLNICLYINKSIMQRKISCHFLMLARNWNNLLEKNT